MVFFNYSPRVHILSLHLLLHLLVMHPSESDKRPRPSHLAGGQRCLVRARQHDLDGGLHSGACDHVHVHFIGGSEGPPLQVGFQRHWKTGFLSRDEQGRDGWVALVMPCRRRLWVGEEEDVFACEDDEAGPELREENVIKCIS